MNKFKKIMILSLFSIVILSIFMLMGCDLEQINDLSKYLENNTSLNFNKRECSIRTYDENSYLIDEIAGKSINVQSDSRFSQTNEEGDTIKNSSILNIIIDGKEMTHVGSSLIIKEKNLTDLLENNKKICKENIDKSKPFINSVINTIKDDKNVKQKIVLIMSQSGKPLAIFSGDNVSYFSPGMNKSTGLLIDGKYLFVYKCDYIIYDKTLFK